MRVTDNGNVQSLRRKRQANRTSRAGGFADHLVDGATTDGVAATTGPTSLASLDALLAVQGDGFDQDAPQSEFDRGMLTLDRLHELRLELLTGEPNRQTLEEVGRLTRERVDEKVSPEMREILNEIEVRAAVEIAKLEHQV